MRAYKVVVVTDDGAPDHREYRSTELWATEPTEQDVREIERISNGRGSPAIWWAESWSPIWVTGSAEAALRRGERPEM